MNTNEYLSFEQLEELSLGIIDAFLKNEKDYKKEIKELVKTTWIMTHQGFVNTVGSIRSKEEQILKVREELVNLIELHQVAALFNSDRLSKSEKEKLKIDLLQSQNPKDFPNLSDEDFLNIILIYKIISIHCLTLFAQILEGEENVGWIKFWEIIFEEFAVLSFKHQSSGESIEFPQVYLIFVEDIKNKILSGHILDNGEIKNLEKYQKEILSKIPNEQKAMGLSEEFTVTVTIVWAALGPFKSGKESANAFRKAALAIHGEELANEMEEGFLTHEEVFNADPKAWEEIRKTALGLLASQEKDVKDLIENIKSVDGLSQLGAEFNLEVELARMPDGNLRMIRKEVPPDEETLAGMKVLNEAIYSGMGETVIKSTSKEGKALKFFLATQFKEGMGKEYSSSYDIGKTWSVFRGLLDEVPISPQAKEFFKLNKAFLDTIPEGLEHALFGKE